MKHFTFESHWDSIKTALKKRFDHLTDKDLAFVEGKGEELFARLREKLELPARDLKALLEELEADATGRVEQFKTKAAELAGDVREKFDDAVEGAKTKGAAMADEVKLQAGVAMEEARKRVRTLRKDGEEYVRQNPREVLVAALCAGFVAGLLVRR